MATHIMNDPPAFLFHRFAGLFVVVHIVHLLHLNSTLSRQTDEKNLVDRNAHDLTDSFRGCNGGIFRRCFDFSICIARNAEFFRHFPLGESSVLASLFHSESQLFSLLSFGLGNTILHF